MHTSWHHLFGISRENIPEIGIYGAWAFKRHNQPPEELRTDIPIVMRSLLKPWQAMACGFGPADSLERVALMCASHSGEESQIQVVDEFLKDFNLTEASLACPESYPMNPTRSIKLQAEGSPKQRIFHPCSGKHAGMLVACRRQGFEVEGYARPEHPQQKAVRSFIEKKAGDKLDWLADSCGLPAAVLTITKQLALWELLGCDTDSLSVRLKEAWVKRPVMVGGHGRLDSEIVQQFQGMFLAKEGADGLLMVQSTQGEGGAFIKLSSGYNSNYLGVALFGLLRKIQNLPPSYKRLRDYLELKLTSYIPSDQQVRF